ncbi:MAG: hypothetical protein U1A78_39615 [Polyangia bacterium]
MSRDEPRLDLAAVRLELQRTGDGAFRDTAWLRRSLAEPAAFTSALLLLQAALAPPPLKSSVEAGYDLYHDLVLRHVSSPHPALRVVEPDAGVRALGYGELHALCSRRAAAWAAQGARAGESLCLIGPVDAELVIALMAALRLGLLVSLLPPHGPDLITKRLAALRPDRVAAARRYQPLLRGTPSHDCLLADEPPGPLGPQVEARSHTYGPDDPVLRLFSPLRDPPTEAMSVTASEAFLGALRDGLLFLSLQPGRSLAAPGSPLLQVQPALLLATLLQGATFVALTPADLAHAGGQKALDAVQVLFVTAAVRDTLLGLPSRPLASLRLWLRDPLEPAAPTRWASWVEHCGLQRAAAAGLLYDAACGGGVLFSLRQTAVPPLPLQPVPGRRFTLLEPEGGGRPARGEQGVLEPLPGSPGLLLARRDGAYLYAGTLQPSRAGQRYPSAEVEDCAAALPFVRSAVVLLERGEASEPLLLIFTGPEPLERAHRLAPRREALVRERLSARLGDELVPSEIVQYALLPRQRQGSVDRAWCLEQHRRDALRAREASPIFQLLDRLRLSLVRPRPAAPLPTVRAR